MEVIPFLIFLPVGFILSIASLIYSLKIVNLYKIFTQRERNKFKSILFFSIVIPLLYLYILFSGFSNYYIIIIKDVIKNNFFLFG